MRFVHFKEGVGRITKQNQTVDVGPNEISIQAAKFGNSVDKDGRPKSMSKKTKGSKTNVLFNLGLSESVDEKKLNNYKSFINFCCEELKVKSKPSVRLTSKELPETFGYYDIDENSITVSYANRHQMDVMRTIAHEIVHHLQRESKEDLDGSDGSIDENEANAIAGVVLRKWASRKPHLFSESVDNLYESVLYYRQMKENLGEIAQATEIYVDMDGVLADFFGEWSKLMNVDHFSKIDKQHDIKDALQKIRDTNEFWLKLPLLPQAKQLLAVIKQIKGKYNICSSPLADDPNSEPHKREWIKKNLSFFPPEKVIITHNKSQYATQQDGTPNILIDDFGKNVDSWEAAGGTAFKYKDHKFERTAKAIKQHMQEPVEESIIVEHPAVIAALYAAGTTARELVKRYGLKAVKQALDKLKNQKKNIKKPANDHGGYVDNIIAATKKTRTPAEIARAQRMNLPRALENAKAMIRHTSKDYKAGKLSREEFTNIMRYLRVNFKRKTGKELPIEDFLKLIETKEAPPGTYFTKTGNLVKGRLTKSAKDRGARETDPKDKTRSKVPPVTQQNESMDNPYPFKWDYLRREGGSRTKIKLADDSILDINITEPDYGSYDIEFSRGGTLKPTGDGDEFRIFATVVAAITEWWNQLDKENVREVYFSAAKADGGRSQLYKRFVQMFSKKTGWDYDYDDSGKTVSFGITNPQMAENFADGKKKGKSRPGRVKRSGASCNGSVTALRKRAKNASGEKAKMYHWCANMKSGK